MATFSALPSLSAMLRTPPEARAKWLARCGDNDDADITLRAEDCELLNSQLKVVPPPIGPLFVVRGRCVAGMLGGPQ